MYLEKIFCAGLLLFVIGVALNIATLITVIKVSHDDSIKRASATHIAESFE